MAGGESRSWIKSALGKYYALFWTPDRSISRRDPFGTGVKSIFEVASSLGSKENTPRGDLPMAINV
jgi:hypothetical protein